MFRVLAALLTIVVLGFLSAESVHAADAPAQYVIHISVDGLGASWLEALEKDDQLPTFKRLEAEGAFTHNARTDFDYTITLPNHTSMVTGRPVKDKTGAAVAIAGHLWTVNTDPGDKTIHGNRHDYVKSTFDVAHDNGLRTAMFASKGKFRLYDQTYDEKMGAPDTTGPDNGRDKIDLSVIQSDSVKLMERYLAEMKANPFNYTFLHFHDADTAGHAKTWGSPEYNAAVKAVDGYLAQILDLIDNDPRLKGKTAIILSADHGGTGLDHGYNSNPLNYTIPFLVWGAGVVHKDLYELNTSSRVNPQTGRPDYTAADGQPIRNGDGGNLALKLLGLPAIPDSLINAQQNLNVQ